MISRPKPRQNRPSAAQKVFSGDIFSVYQWQQEMFDGSFQQFEQVCRIDTVTIIPVRDTGKIILAKQVQPGTEKQISSIGGRIGMGEEPLHAAKRELREETGLASNNWKLWRADQYLEKIDWCIYTFIAYEPFEVIDTNPDNGELIQLFEVDFDILMQLSKQDHFRDFDLSLMLYRATRNPKQLSKLRKALKADK